MYLRDWWCRYLTMYSEKNYRIFLPRFHCSLSLSLSLMQFWFSIMRNVEQFDQLPWILTRSWHVALIRRFPSTFPFLTNSPWLAGSSSQRAQGLPLFRKAQYATATAGWATCPPQSCQYRPSLSITFGERQYVRRKATNSTNSVSAGPWKGTRAR